MFIFFPNRLTCLLFFSSGISTWQSKNMEKLSRNRAQLFLRNKCSSPVSQQKFFRTATVLQYHWLSSLNFVQTLLPDEFKWWAFSMERRTMLKMSFYFVHISPIIVSWRIKCLLFKLIKSLLTKNAFSCLASSPLTVSLRFPEQLTSMICCLYTVFFFIINSHYQRLL